MLKSQLLSFIFLCFPGLFFGQIHRIPTPAGEGLPGIRQGSFIIGWEKVADAVAYEYVLTTNFLCFQGCAGDTRNHTVVDTFAIEYELVPDTWYYWITRVRFADSSYTDWSGISYFRTFYAQDRPIAPVQPNPASDFTLIQADWSSHPNASLLRVTVYDVRGNIVLPPRVWARNGGFLRSDAVEFDVQPLTPGLYLLRTELIDAQGQAIRSTTERLLKY